MITHFAKGNINHYRESFRSICSSVPFKMKDARATYSQESIDCIQCLEVFISLKKIEIAKAEDKIIEICEKRIKDGDM
jgi:hypothetical protein